MNVKTLDIDSGRLFFVSDIHGELTLLKKALHEVGFDYQLDTLVCAGDLIDRGEDSLGVIRFFMEHDNLHTVKGNHDLFATNRVSIHETQNWIYNGGAWAFETAWLDLYKEPRWLFELPYALDVKYEGNSYGVVHASVPEDFESWQQFLAALERNNPAVKRECVWDRSIAYHPEVEEFQVPLEGIDWLIHGHCVLPEPRLIGNRWHIDTGAVFGKGLTLAEVFKGDLRFTRHD